MYTGQVIDSGFYDSFNRGNVRLVDLSIDKSGAISVVSGQGMITADGEEHMLDAIVFATGFDAMTGPVLGLNVTGRGGVPLREKWAAGPKTYLGLQMAGFPNFFTVTGPGSPSVLSNMMVSIEQVQYSLYTIHYTHTLRAL
jgi:cation diffusion facilitator CzcD-associated flavoprotein CzcO